MWEIIGEHELERKKQDKSEKQKKLALKSIIGESQLTHKITTIVAIEHWPRSEKHTKVANKIYWTK